MVNNVWDIVNEDRLRPNRPSGHIICGADASPETIAGAKSEAEKYDTYIADFRKAACLLVESI